MKRILLFCIVMLMGVSAFSQIQATYNFAQDTLIADTILYFTVPQQINGNYVYAAQMKLDSAAATPTIVITPQAQILPNVWIDLAAADTVMTAGVPASVVKTLTGTTTPWLRYRWKIQGGGTPTGDRTALSGRIVFKKQ